MDLRQPLGSDPPRKNEGRLATALVSYPEVNPCKVLHLSAVVLLFLDPVFVCPAIFMFLLVIMTVFIVVLMRWHMDIRHYEGTHHLVILVLDDVAVPHIETGEIELRLDGEKSLVQCQSPCP